MSGMVDIHCHILPGIDDGPTDMAGSIEMARRAVECGIRTVAATPHLRADFPKVKVDELADRCAELRAAIAAEGLDLDLAAAGEVSLSWAIDADDHQLRLSSYGQRGTDILIETPRFGGGMLPGLLGQIASRGYRIVLAHPERLSDFHRDKSLPKRLVEQGVILQVNADGLLEDARRSSTARAARQLCKAGWVSLVASDAHRGVGWRPIGRLAQSRDVLARLLGDEAMASLLETAPAAVVAGLATPLMTEHSSRRVVSRWRT